MKSKLDASTSPLSDEIVQDEQRALPVLHDLNEIRRDLTENQKRSIPSPITFRFENSFDKEEFLLALIQQEQKRMQSSDNRDEQNRSVDLSNILQMLEKGSSEGFEVQLVSANGRSSLVVVGPYWASWGSGRNDSVVIEIGGLTTETRSGFGLLQLNDKYFEVLDTLPTI
jgi:hypothetical protein